MKALVGLAVYLAGARLTFLIGSLAPRRVTKTNPVIAGAFVAAWPVAVPAFYAVVLVQMRGEK